MSNTNKNQGRRTTAFDKIIFAIPLVYIISVSVYMVSHRAWFSPDQFFAFAMIAVILLGKTKQFLWDWVPMLLLLFGYEYLRGLVPLLSKNPNIYPMINADKFLFGGLPTITLQTVLYKSTSFQWYDYMSVVLYISHFIVPMVVAFAFWLYSRRLFKEFTIGLLVLSYLAFVTYIIYPAMPPWMASDLGYIPPLQKIMNGVMASFAHPISVPSVYKFFGANLVAAVPSLHAAYPFLIYLYIRQQWKLASLFVLPYVLGVWFAVVYLGEHYFIDVIIGVFYAAVSYYLIYTVTHKRKFLFLKAENKEKEQKGGDFRI